MNPNLFQNLVNRKLITARQQRTLQAIFQSSGSVPVGAVSVNQISTATGYSRRTVFYHLKRFRESGILDIARREVEGLVLSSVYTFCSLATATDKGPLDLDIAALQEALKAPVRKERERAALLFYREQAKRKKGRFGGRSKMKPKTYEDRLRDAQVMAWQCQCDPDNWLPEERKLCGDKFDRYLKHAQSIVLLWRYLVDTSDKPHEGKWATARTFHIKQAIRLAKWLEESVDPADGLPKIPMQTYLVALFIGLRNQFEQGWVDGTVPIPSFAFLRSKWCQRVYLVHKDDAEAFLAKRKIKLWVKDPGTAYQEYCRDHIKPRLDERLYDQSRHHMVNNLAPTKGVAAYTACAEFNGVLKSSDICPKCPFFKHCQTETLRYLPWQALLTFGLITMEEAVRLRKGYMKDPDAGRQEADRLLALGKTGKDFYVYWRLWP